MIQITDMMCEHAGLLLPISFGIISLLGWLLYKERCKVCKTEDDWHKRIEAKLDKALKDHNDCQKVLPFVYVTKAEFKELQEERNRQWETFNRKFDDFIGKYWNHSHDTEGSVKRQ